MDKIIYKNITTNDNMVLIVQALIDNQAKIIDELKRKTQAGYGNYMARTGWEYELDVITMIELLFDHFSLDLKNINGSHKIIKKNLELPKDK